MKNANLKKACLLFCLVFLCMFHLPFSFAESSVRDASEPMNAEEANNASNLSDNTAASMVYSHLNLDKLGLSMDAYCHAVAGFEKLKSSGRIANDHIITIIDFTKSSASKRLYVIDMENEKLLFNTYVAHGQNSGNEFATRFSNSPESFQSSLGFYETSGTYSGKHGYSMFLIGLEKGINDRADERAIVMHGADYVSEQYIRFKGYIGRSWGCPAVPEKLSKPIIDRIKNGSCLFIYANNKTYLKRSRILNS